MNIYKKLIEIIIIISKLMKNQVVQFLKMQLFLRMKAHSKKFQSKKY